ncbi:MAG: hypothetical protein IIZ78_06055 [Clostridiales bacterium]|nr:hypothetical protein [Clostridiales bacterium]
MIKEVFNGEVNGVKFDSIEAMQNYVNDLKKNNQSIRSYKTSYSIENIDDEEELFEDINVNSNSLCESNLSHLSLDKIAVPKPYKTVEEYIAPILDDVDLDVMTGEKRNDDRVEEDFSCKLEDRMKYLCNFIDTISKEDLDRLYKKTYNRVDGNKERLYNMMRAMDDRIENLEQEIERCHHQVDLLESLQGYQQAIVDILKDKID